MHSWWFFVFFREFWCFAPKDVATKTIDCVRRFFLSVSIAKNGIVLDLLMKDYPSHLLEHAISNKNYQKQNKKNNTKKANDRTSHRISGCFGQIAWIVLAAFFSAEWLKSNHDMRTEQDKPKMLNVKREKFVARFCTNCTRHKFMLMSFQVVPQRIPVTNDLQKHKYRHTNANKRTTTTKNYMKSNAKSICST